MALGSVAYVLECQPDGTLSASVAPCVDVVGAYYKPVQIQAYVIDPASASLIDGLGLPFDYALAGQFFLFGFVFVVALHLFSYFVGQIVDMIKHM